MRVSTSLLAQTAIDAMNEQRVKLSLSQMQVSTGRKIIAPADDPYNSGRALYLTETVSIISQYTENSTFAQIRNQLEEGTLDAAVSAVQRIRELAVYANNDTHSVESRKSIREEVIRLRDQILSLANTTDSANEFLFAGYQGNTKPFIKDGFGNVQYFGDDGQRYLQVGSATEIAAGDPGSGVFVNIRNGNGTFQTQEDAANTGTGIIDTGTVIGSYVPGNYTIGFMSPTAPTPGPNNPNEYYVLDSNGLIIEPAASVGMTEVAFLGSGNPGIPYPDASVIQGLDTLGMQVMVEGDPAPGDKFYLTPSSNQSLFNTIQNFLNTLISPQTSEPDSAHFHNAMNRVLADLDQGLNNLTDIRARIGARLRIVDRQVEINETYQLQMKTTLSSIEDVDYAEAITRMNLEMVGLQAAQQSYSKIQNLSLFNYI